MALKRVSLAVACLFFLAARPLLPSGVGEGDFRAYWSASYLLARGENFADPARLFQVEREQTGWDENFSIIAWNPPWLLALLVPYTFMPFAQAVWWWLLTNIVVVFVSAVILWQLSTAHDLTRRRAWIAPLVAIAYSPTLVSLVTGQINLIVLAGLTGFLFFTARRQEARAGAALALTMVKPHLVYLTVPILLLDSVRRRHWRTLAGFMGLLIGLSSIVFLSRPSFVWEYGASLSSGSLFQWETPTLGGFLDVAFGWQWSKLVGLVILPLAVWLWWRYGREWDTRPLVDVTLLVSVITAPYGWSYDFVVLLVPLISVIVGAIEGKFTSVEVAAVVLILLGANTVLYYERVVSPSEVYFFWLPLLIASLYVFALTRSAKSTVLELN